MFSRSPRRRLARFPARVQVTQQPAALSERSIVSAINVESISRAAHGVLRRERPEAEEHGPCCQQGRRQHRTNSECWRIRTRPFGSLSVNQFEIFVLESGRLAGTAGARRMRDVRELSFCHTARTLLPAAVQHPDDVLKTGHVTYIEVAIKC